MNFSCINGEKDNCCSICMEDYTTDCKVYRLDCCKKIIHTDCIEKWFSKYNHTCPLCRHKYDTNEEEQSNSLLMELQPMVHKTNLENIIIKIYKISNFIQIYIFILIYNNYVYYSFNTFIIL